MESGCGIRQDQGKGSIGRADLRNCPQTQRASQRGRTVCGHCSQEAQVQKEGVDESRWRPCCEGPDPCALLRLWWWATEFCNQGSSIIRCVLERWVWEHHCQGWTSASLSSFSSSVVSDSFWPRGLQHVRLPCPSPSPRACSNSCPSSQWCHPTISSSIIPFSSCLQSLPASGAFPVSRLFSLGGQRIRASASASVLSMNIQDWFRLDWLVWSPCIPRDSQKSAPAPSFKSISFLALNHFMVQLSHRYDYWKKP